MRERFEAVRTYRGSVCGLRPLLERTIPPPIIFCPSLKLSICSSEDTNESSKPDKIVVDNQMSTKAEVQDLLRFLARDAKVPLATAMGKIKELQQAALTR